MACEPSACMLKQSVFYHFASADSRTLYSFSRSTVRICPYYVSINVTLQTFITI